VALQLRGVETEGNPVIDEGTQALVVGQLLADGGEVFKAHELTVAPALPGIAQLVVGTAPAGRVGLAAAAGGAADIVLLGEMAGAQGAELCKLGFDLLKAPLDGGLRVRSRQRFTPIADK
jgi:hypothetical protein